jgi:hypothetical protein
MLRNTRDKITKKNKAALQFFNSAVIIMLFKPVHPVRWSGGYTAAGFRFEIYKIT